MSGKLTHSLETATRKQIDLMLLNLGWHTDESSPDCNVYTGRAKTTEQDSKFAGNDPDYVLYKSGTDDPIGIIEAKRKGQDIDEAIEDAKTKYANPLGVKLIFAYDGAFFKSWHTEVRKELTIDGVAVTQLVSERRLLRFLREGPDLSELTPAVKHSRTELISIFKWANDLLRKEGLREGVERFTEFANLLFLKLISEMEHEREKEGEPRILDAQYCWEAFSNLDAVTMANYINDTVLPYLVAKYNHSGDVFESRLLIKNPKTLATIVHRLSGLNLMSAESDVKGDAFEYFLKDSVTVGNDLGEYFTPRHLVNLMIELVEPKFGEKIYDPTCGTAGFLIATFNYIGKRCAKTKENYRKLKEETVFGRELTNTAKIAKMNMILAGDGHTNIVQTDSLANPIDSTYNVVLANPPYGQLTDYGEYYPVSATEGDAIFIQHIHKSLVDGGRAAVVVPEGLLFKAGDMQRVRKYLLRHSNVLGVISLPQGVFRPYANSKTNIIVFEKTETGTKSIWFYDLTADGFETTSDFRKPVRQNDIPDLLKKWVEKAESEKSWSVPVEKIVGNGYKLVVKEYEPKVTQFASRYPFVKFATIMKEAKQTIMIDDRKKYQRITAQFHGNGVIHRDYIKGADLKTKQQRVVKGGQFIVAQIDAKLGGYGVVPDELEGAIVSNHYFLFNLDKSKVLPMYFDYIVRNGPYEEMIRPFVKGTTNYADVRAADVLRLVFPLPPLSVQKRFIVEIDRQMALRQKASAKIDSMLQKAIKSNFRRTKATAQNNSTSNPKINNFLHGQ